MATCTKKYTLDLTSTGNYIYEAIDKLEDNVDQLVTNLNSAHTTTRGDMIYKGASAVGRLAVGTKGDVVVSDGTDPTWGIPSAETFTRSQFTYNGGTTAYTIKAAPARYWCKDKYCYWTSELTSAAIGGTPSADAFYYYYLDYSAITSGTEVTNSEFVWSVTAPSYNGTYYGWYNGDDLCVMAVRTNSAPDNVLEFFHDGGDYVCYSAPTTDDAVADPGTDFANEVTLSIPGFSQRANVRFVMNYVDGAPGYGKWRNTDDTDGAGQIVTEVEAGCTSSEQVCDVFCNSSQKIDTAVSSTSDTLGLYTNGWYFPNGM